MYTIKFYKTSKEEYLVKDFIEELDKKSQAKIYRYLMLLQDNGHDLPRPYADHVQGKIRELRVVTQAGNVRIFYFFFIRNDIILLHAFKKKTQELPIREIEKAERNMNDFTVRYGRSEFK